MMSLCRMEVSGGRISRNSKGWIISWEASVKPECWRSHPTPPAPRPFFSSRYRQTTVGGHFNGFHYFKYLKQIYVQTLSSETPNGTPRPPILDELLR
jgi:hypothetical protein